MCGSFGNLGLLLFSLLIGGLISTVGYTPFFVSLAVLDLVAALLLWVLVREPLQPVLVTQ
jgi:ACS family hexuronate transporter-like MFS transporter